MSDTCSTCGAGLVPCDCGEDGHDVCPGCKDYPEVCDCGDGQQERKEAS